MTFVRQSAVIFVRQIAVTFSKRTTVTFARQMASSGELVTANPQMPLLLPSSSEAFHAVKTFTFLAASQLKVEKLHVSFPS